MISVANRVSDPPDQTTEQDAVQLGKIILAFVRQRTYADSNSWFPGRAYNTAADQQGRQSTLGSGHLSARRWWGEDSHCTSWSSPISDEFTLLRSADD
jgi:hypothetical protein